jgi:hypothetical protein
MSGKYFDSQNGTLTENFLATGGEVAEVEQRGAKSGRLTEGPQRLRYATGGGYTFFWPSRTSVCLYSVYAICGNNELPEA